MKALILSALTVLGGIALAPFKVEKCSETAGKLEETTQALKFHYAVGNRFYATVTPNELKAANTIFDLIPEDANWEQFQIHGTTISLFEEDRVYATNESVQLNNEQKSVLTALTYTDQIVLKASSWAKKDGTLREYDHDLVYYISIVPDIEARYIDGHEELMRFLREGSKETIKKAENWKLKPGKLSFTISAEGEPTNAHLLHSCGYPEVDSTLLELVLTTTGKWFSALDAGNKPVDQELYFSFGQEGC